MNMQQAQTAQPQSRNGACIARVGAADASALESQPAGQRFGEAERRRLLMANGIGERLVVALEEAGFVSLESLCRRGAAAVIADVENRTGSTAWRGRGPRLARVLALLQP